MTSLCYNIYNRNKTFDRKDRMMTREEIENALAAAFISTGIVADILATSKIHVYNLIKEGRLEAINIGAGSKNNIYRVKSESVRRILEGATR